MSGYIPTEDEVETAFSTFAAELAIEFPGEYPEAPEFATIKGASEGFYRYLNQVKADAWDEGAETAWKRSGEGHNGEYTSLYGTHDGTAPFLLANEHVTNPYRKQEEV